MEDALTNCKDLSWDHYSFLDEGIRAVNKNNAGRVKGQKAIQNVSAQGGLASVFQGGNPNVSFLLPIGGANQLDVCTSMILELTILNNDGANAATLLAGQALLTNIITMTGNNIENSQFENQLVRRLYSSSADEELFQRATLEYFSYAGYPAAYTTSATTIAAGGSTKVYLQIFTPFDCTQCFLPAITTQITVQCYFNATGMTSTSLASSISLTDARLIMHGIKYQNNIRAALLNKFAAKPHIYAYYAGQREILSGVSVSAANEQNFQVSAMSGFNLAALWLGVRAANASQEDLYTFESILTVDERINGTSVYNSKLNKQEFSAMAMDNNIQTSVPNGNTNLIMLPHSVDVYQSLKWGKLRGYQLYNPNVNILLQMSSVTGNRDLVAIGLAASVIIIDKGTVRLEYL